MMPVTPVSAERLQTEQARRDATTKALDDIESAIASATKEHDLLTDFRERHSERWTAVNELLQRLYQERKPVVEEWFDAHRWSDDPAVNARAQELL
jgi:hypothetical protein